MSKGGKKHVGAGAHGKCAGTGANTDIEKEKIGENMVLSNREKSQHSDQRGMDSSIFRTSNSRITRRTGSTMMPSSAARCLGLPRRPVSRLGFPNA